MTRKIVKILISLLFLAVTALAAVFAIKNFLPDLFERESKYGVRPISVSIPDETLNAPVITPSEEEMKRRLAAEDKYGVAPIRRPVPSRIEESKYGVAPVRRKPSQEEMKKLQEEEKRDAYELKYGVAPIRRNTQTKN